MPTPKVSVISFGIKKITITAGTPQRILSSSADAYWVGRYTPDIRIVSKSTNTGDVYLGDVDVDSDWDPITPGQIQSWTHGNGRILGEGPSDGFDLYNLWIDGSHNGDIVWVKFLMQKIVDV